MNYKALWITGYILFVLALILVFFFVADEHRFTGFIIAAVCLGVFRIAIYPLKKKSKSVK
ncbi:hypothetical protein [Terribacillus sp. FSL K6-0262]|uniref:hypothetical protein n=1 Tax=Terribacillus TaxID=459532 RepID=UPI0030EC241A